MTDMCPRCGRAPRYVTHICPPLETRAGPGIEVGGTFNAVPVALRRLRQLEAVVEAARQVRDGNLLVSELDPYLDALDRMCPVCDGVGAQSGAHTERICACPGCSGTGLARLEHDAPARDAKSIKARDAGNGLLGGGAE